MWGWIKPIFETLIGPLTRAIAMLAAFFTGRKQGRLESENLGLREQAERTKEANRARSEVAGRSDDDLDDGLRPPDRRR